MALSRKWSSKEDKYIRDLRKSGLSHQGIGDLIGRSEAAVRQQLSKPPIADSKKDMGNTLIIRTRMNFKLGCLYEIRPLHRTSGFEFLPAIFEFIGEIQGQTCLLYQFKSMNGNYSVCFSHNQLMDTVSSPIAIRKEKTQE